MHPALLNVLQHSLGCDQYGRPTPLGRRPNFDDDFGCYRNRFVTDSTSPDGRNCSALVSLGYMRDQGTQNFLSGMHCYTVTQAGYEAMKQSSPPPPKITAAKRRWAAYRAARKVLNFSFVEYLRWPRRAEHEAAFQI